MDTLLHVGLSNAVLVLPLVVLAAGATAWGRRPALAHGLWLLVLVKLVTPPMLSLPIPRWTTEQTAPSEPVPLIVEQGEVRPVTLVELPVDPAPLPEMEAEPAAEAGPESKPAIELPAASVAWHDKLHVREPASAPPSDWVSPLLVSIWLGGTAIWVVLGAVRVRQFRQLLQHARPAPEHLQSQADSLASRLGARTCPPVRLVPGSISPMLWGLGGKAVLLMPVELLDRLDDEQRASLLVHELAHFRRRDHWVRLVELLATALYWWNPIVWMARRGLRAAEEQCCDAWVVWALPAAARAYADALVETVDFLSESRLALPPAASGIGHVRILKRRLTMILQGAPARKLSTTGTIAVLGLGAVILPWMASWAQGEEPPPDAQIRKAVKFLIENQKADDPQKAAEIEKAKNELVKMTMELEKMREQLHLAVLRFAESQQRLQQLVGGGEFKERIIVQMRGTAPGGPDARIMMTEVIDVLAAQVRGKEAAVAEAEARAAQAKARFLRNQELAARGAMSAEEVDNARAELRIAEAQLKGKQAEFDEARARMDAARRHGDAAPTTRSGVVTKPIGEDRATIRVTTKGQEAGESDRRMRDLEMKLADLLKEVEGLRQDMKRQAPGPRIPAPPLPPASRER